MQMKVELNENFCFPCPPLLNSLPFAYLESVKVYDFLSPVSQKHKKCFHSFSK